MKKYILISLIIFIFFPAVIFACFETSDYKFNNFMPMMYNLRNNNIMGWTGNSLTFGIIGFILMILWLLFVIAAFIFLIKWLAKQFKGGDESSSFEILKERYARGEIDKTEFEEMKKDIS